MGAELFFMNLSAQGTCGTSQSNVQHQQGIPLFHVQQESRHAQGL